LTKAAIGVPGVRPARDNALGLGKPDVPALKALDRYTKLSTHERTTYSDRIFNCGLKLSDIKSSNYKNGDCHSSETALTRSGDPLRG